MPRDSNCDYLAFVMWVETKAALREMICLAPLAIPHARARKGRIPSELSNTLTFRNST
jgi:hypothetical protein